MLKSVDILIGFSVIMLVVSMSVTLIIQWIVHILGMRGKELLKGLTALLQQIDPKLLTPEHAEEIATKILTNPMLARSGEKLAGVVQREELIKTVLEIAAGAGAPSSQPPAPVGGNAAPPASPPTNVPATAEQALAMALAKLGIPDPGKKLDAIRLFSMRLEATNPELATHVREAQAVITEAESQFVAKVNGWFDPTMDRVSQSFTNQSRYWTAGISLILALLLQIDAFKIVNRLSIDDALRASLVSGASKIPAPQGSAEKPATPASNATPSNPAPATVPATPPETANDQKAKLEKLENDTRDNVAQLRVLATDQLITWPTWPDVWKHWWEGWSGSNISVFGVLLSAMLLSFGAPFWFNVLGGLLKLRPLLAAKDDQQRQDRESSQTPADGGGSTPAAVASGERGDLSAG
jgi:hypothetical protein